MCGILGIIGNQSQTVPSNLLSQLSHRGPDSHGWFQDDHCFLGHTRLSILDLSDNGSQPMYSDDSRYIIIFNGEVYNHLEIRANLQEYEFKSTSDTETVLYAYIKYGTTALNMFNGIFSIAIYDNQTNELLIARDAMGVKPLYFYQDKERFLFASELKVLTSLGIDKTISGKALANYLTFLWSPGILTPFENVKKLLPGHYFKFKVANVNEAKPIKYYQIPFKGQYLDINEAELTNMLEQKLINAVKRQLLSDVPVGFFLSGGLDSSLLVAIARKIAPEQDMQCFTVGLSDEQEKEGFAHDLPYAQQVATYLGVKLNIVDASVNILKDFDKMIWHLDEPQGDVAPLHVLNICKHARQNGIHVLIGGAAGDDLFSGYRRHQALKFEKVFTKVPQWMARWLLKILNNLRAENTILRRLKKLSNDIGQSQLERMAGYFSWLPYQSLLAILTEENRLQLASYSPLNNLIDLNRDIPHEKSLLNQMLYWELKTFLVDHNLNYTDKLSMAVGVEVRTPYLDLELVDFSTKIPPEFKMKGITTKYLLRKVAERYLPAEVVNRSKTGFGAPVRSWILNDLSAMINVRLSSEKIIKRGIFDAQSVWQLIDDNKSGKIDASYTILALLAIESWMIQFVDHNHD